MRLSKRAKRELRDVAAGIADASTIARVEQRIQSDPGCATYFREVRDVVDAIESVPEAIGDSELALGFHSRNRSAILAETLTDGAPESANSNWWWLRLGFGLSILIVGVLIASRLVAPPQPANTDYTFARSTDPNSLGQLRFAFVEGDDALDFALSSRAPNSGRSRSVIMARGALFDELVQ